MAAPGRGGIYDAAITAVSELVADRANVLEIIFALASGEDSLKVVARSSPGGDNETMVDDVVDLDALPTAARDSLANGHAARCPALGPRANPSQRPAGAKCSSARSSRAAG